MDQFGELLDMGFLINEITEAMSIGLSTNNDIADYILQKRSEPETNVLRLHGRGVSQFQPEPYTQSQPFVNTEPPTSAATESDEPIVQRLYTYRSRYFELEEEEAQKLRERLRKEEIEKKEARKLELQRIEDDKAERTRRELERRQIAAQMRSSQPSTSHVPPTDSSHIQVRISLPPGSVSSADPPAALIGEFDLTTATKADLEAFVEAIANEHSTEHHGALSLSLPCVSIFQYGQRGSSFNFGSGASQLLRDLGITANTRFVLAHDPRSCPVVELRAEGEESGTTPATEAADLNADTEGTGDSRPPEQEEEEEEEDLRLFEVTVPSPPQQPAGHFRHPLVLPNGTPWPPAAPTPVEPEPQLRLKRSTPPLRDLCLKCVADAITKVTMDVNSSGGELSKHSSGDMECMRLLMSGQYFLPQYLVVRIIDRLRSDNAFTPMTVKFLRNFTEVLDLDLYPFVTTDLVLAVTRHWSSLRALCLSTSQTQISPYAIESIGKLRRLQVLHLDWHSNVADSTISALATLPHLRSLRIKNTSVTDGGWKALKASGCPVSPLELLNLSGTHLTDIGLCALAELFPNLVWLDISHTAVAGVAPILSRPTPLANLKCLAANGSALRNLPPCCIPPVGSSGGTGLHRLNIDQCSSLSVEHFLDGLPGQPVVHLEGFFHLGQTTLTDLHRLADLKLPLREWNLAAFSASRRLTMRGLCSLLRACATDHLRVLTLPFNTCPMPPNEDLSTELVESLSGARNLQVLHLGIQGRLLSTKQLRRLMLSTPRLQSLFAFNLTRAKLQLISDLAPLGCRVSSSTLIDP